MAKKKSQKKKPAQPGIDPNEKRRERLEAKREAKAKALAAQRKREARGRLVRRIALFSFLAFAVWFLFIRPGPPNEINGNPINEFAVAGANQHTTSPVSYQDNPPVSGEHAPTPGPCGVLNASVPNETMVHTLEHGAVGILYQPDLDPEQIKELEAIVGEYNDHVFSAPYDGGMESPITLAAWAYTMELDSVESASINDFIEEFRAGGVAPEANQDCPNGEPQPFEAEGAEADPEATPHTDETPHDEETPAPGRSKNATPEPSPSS